MSESTRGRREIEGLFDFEGEDSSATTKGSVWFYLMAIQMSPPPPQPTLMILCKRLTIRNAWRRSKRKGANSQDLARVRGTPWHTPKERKKERKQQQEGVIDQCGSEVPKSPALSSSVLDAKE